MNNSFYGDETKWGFGIVEDVNDPQKAGRVRVRIYGLHDVSNKILSTDDLPWSQVSLPTTEAGISGIGKSPVGLVRGSMVHGIFLDGDSKQNFLVVGTIVGLNRASTVQDQIQEDLYELKGFTNPEKAFNFFRNRIGYSEEISSGIVGSLCFHVDDETLPTNKIKEETFGIGLWDSRKRELLKELARARNTSEEDLQTQLIFVTNELESNNSLWPNYALDNGTIVSPRTSSEASDAFTQQFYRKSTSFNAQRRKDFSHSIFASYGSIAQEVRGFSSLQSPKEIQKGDHIHSQEQFHNILSSSSRSIDMLVLHHADTYEDMDTDVNDIDNWHKERGFDEIGYHFVIRRDGRIQYGRSINKDGAHAKGFNQKSIGVCLIGGLVGSSQNAGRKIRSSSTFTDAQWNSLEKITEAFLWVFPGGKTVGHRDLSPERRTDPEFDFNSWVKSQFSKWTSSPSKIPSTHSSQEFIDSSLEESSPDLVSSEPAKVVDIENEDFTEETVVDISISEPSEDLEDAPSGLFVALGESVEETEIPNPFSDPLSSIVGSQGQILADIDLSEFLNTEKTNILISAALLGYYTQAQIDEKFDNIDFTGYATEAYVTNSLVAYALKSNSISQFADVSLSSPSTGNVLRWNGSAFVNSQLNYSDITGTPGSGDFVDLVSNQNINGNKNFSNLTVNNESVWHSGNDGSGSTLDADLLDGQHGSYYLAWNNLTGVPSTFTPSAHTHAADEVTSGTFDIARIPSIPWANLLNVPSTLSGYGISATDILNMLLTVDGSGSGLDADTIGGYSINNDFSSNTIALRSSVGDIRARLFRSSFAAQTTAASSNADIAFRNTDQASDDYIRFMTGSAFMTYLGNFDGAGSGLDADLLDGQHGSYYLAWSNLTGVPSTFTPSAHTHSAVDIISGTFDIARIPSIPWANLTGVPSTLSAYGISAADVLTTIKTVDGSGSGLDADTLDGTQLSNIARTDITETFNHDLVVVGNLRVDGSIDFVNSNEIEVGDSIILLNADEVGIPTQPAGIEIERGTYSNVSLLWNESNDWWEVTTDGTNFYRLITSNDYGAGSGLDADTVDGLHASNFLRSDIANTSIGLGAAPTGDPIHISHTHTFINLIDPSDTSIRIQMRGSSVVDSMQLRLFPTSGYSWFRRESGITAHYDDADTFIWRNNSASNTMTLSSIGTLSVTGIIQSNGNTVWHEGNDGSGSGLDADTVDGFQASDFLREDGSGHLIISGNQIYHTETGHYWESLGNGNSFFTQFGHIELGPLNASFAHIYTDRPEFYFNKQLRILGAIVWNSGNDGAGSGLDADTVDGYQASNLLDWANFTGVPSTFTPSAHTHPWSEITSTPTTLAGYGISDAYTKTEADSRYLDSASYTPSNILSDLLTVDGSGSALDADLLDGQHGSYYLAWSNLTGVPSTFTPSAHTHPWSEITSTPTTLAGYGISDAYTKTEADSRYVNETDYTASDVLSKINSVDGSGSGLDADTVDGLQASQFLRSDTSDTFTGTLTINGTIDGSDGILQNFHKGAFGNGLTVPDSNTALYTYEVSNDNNNTTEQAIYGWIRSQGDVTNFTGDRYRIGVYGRSLTDDNSTTADANVTFPIGVYGYADIGRGHSDAVYGVHGLGVVSGGADSNGSNVYGGLFEGRVVNAGSTAANLYGTMNQVRTVVDSDQNVSNAYMVRTYLNHDAPTTIGAAYMFHGSVDIEPTATVTTLYGIYADTFNLTDGTVSNERPMWLRASSTAKTAINGQVYIGGENAFNTASETLYVGGSIGTSGAITSTSVDSRLAGLRIGADDDIYLYESATDEFTIRTGPSSAYSFYTFGSTGTLSVGGNQFWNSGNDGSGSGLDADTVDGLQASQFLRSDTSDTMTGNLTLTGSLFASSGIVQTLEVRTGNGQQLVLNAGESHAYATGQTGEYVYVNAEAGLQVNSSPDNWATGWAGRGTTTINGFQIGIGTGVANSLAARPYALAIGDSDTGLAQNGDGQLELWSNNQEIVNVNNARVDFYKDVYTTGNLTLGTVNQGRLSVLGEGRIVTIGDSGITNVPVLKARNSADTAWAFMGYQAYDHIFYANGTERMRILNNGNVTISGNTVWHAGNDGSGSGLDADTVDGYQPSFSTTGNTISLRSSVGDIRARLFRSSFAAQSSSPSSTSAVAFRITDDASNDYIRFMTGDALVGYLGNFDGAGSGLDADTVDGIHASSFYQLGNALSGLLINGSSTDSSLTIDYSSNNGNYNAFPSIKISNNSTATHSFAGIKLEGNNGGVSVDFCVDGLGSGSRTGEESGYIGTVSNDPFHIIHNASSAIDVDSTTITFKNSSSADKFTLNRDTGDLSVTGNVTAYSSDIRLKENIFSIENALEKVKSIRGVEYDWDIEKCHGLDFYPSNPHEHGLIAQEVEAIIPDAVSAAPFNREYKTLKYERVVPLLVEALKESDSKVEALEKEVEALKKMVEKLLEKE